MSNIHATAVSLSEKGVLILGKSGAGKSDLALRLIEQIGAILIADDRVELTITNKEISASCLKEIKGLLEVRGIGIISVKQIEPVTIRLVVELVDGVDKTERLPEREYWEKDGVKIRKIKLYPFEPSAVYKIRLACDETE